MNDRILELMIMSIILLMLLATGYIMPDAVRKEICFGIRIPYEQIDSLEIKNEKSEYKKRYLMTCGIYVFVILLVMWNVYSQWVFLGGLIIFGIISYINYFISYRNMKSIKEKLGKPDEKEYVVVDTNFRNNGKKVLVSPLWFFIPVVLTTADFIAGVMNYSKIPEKIAVHWNASGAADAFAERSFRSVFQIPVSMLILTVLFFIIYLLIKRAKQQINTKDCENSIERSRRFRFIGSVYIAGTSIIVSFIDSLNFYKAIGILNIQSGIYQMLSVIFMIILITSPLVLVFFIGQGGSRLKIAARKKKSLKGEDRNDDSLWKLGIFYYNPSDPSIMVEKRFGVGWTINFGNMKAVIFFIAILAVIITTSILMKP